MRSRTQEGLPVVKRKKRVELARLLRCCQQDDGIDILAAPGFILHGGTRIPHELVGSLSTIVDRESICNDAVQIFALIITDGPDHPCTIRFMGRLKGLDHAASPVAGRREYQGIPMVFVVKTSCNLANFVLAGEPELIKLLGHWAFEGRIIERQDRYWHSSLVAEAGERFLAQGPTTRSGSASSRSA